MQPILKVVTKPTVHLDPERVVERPEAAAQVTHCIAAFSRVETTMSSLFVNLLNTNIAAGADLYRDMQTASAKEAALSSLAASALSAQELPAFHSLLKVVKAARKTRDKYAHWYWGICDQVDDGLALIDPRYLMTYRASILDKRSRGIMSGANLDLSEVYLVRVKGLAADAAHFKQVNNLVFGVANMAAETNKKKRAERLQQLFHDALLRTAQSLEPRATPRKSQKARPELPEKPHRK